MHGVYFLNVCQVLSIFLASGNKAKKFTKQNLEADIWFQ